ncbi:tetratricopeptide repeat protein [Microvirga sp. W0021]|uniref:Tetratricopeptide repeat protein n=1 Tax=Hohaiivirga grylli TaxID=3133970 RepID=A0ABV0BK01_9HYPH
MSDEFFREVDEEYRRDRISEIWKKHSNLIISVVALVIIGVGGYRYWENAQLNKAQDASMRFMQATSLIQQGKNSDAEQILGSLSKDAPESYVLLSRFTAAGDLVAKDTDGAIREYNALAADSKISTDWRDYAKLRSAMLRMNAADPSSAQSDLELLSNNSAWRHTAKEMLVLLFIEKGDQAAARRWLDAIEQDAETPPSLRTRLPLYTGILDGGVVQTVK